MTPLDYETPPPPRRALLWWAPAFARVTSQGAAISIAASMLLFWSMGSHVSVRSAQVMLALASMALFGVGLVAAIAACFVKPSGYRNWVTLATLVVYALLFAIAVSA